MHRMNGRIAILHHIALISLFCFRYLQVSRSTWFHLQFHGISTGLVAGGTGGTGGTWSSQRFKASSSVASFRSGSLPEALNRSSRMLGCFLRGSMMQKTLRDAKGNCVVAFLFFFIVGLPDSRPFPRFQSFQSRFATISLATLPIYNIWQGQMSTLQSQAVCSLVSSHSGKLYGPASKTCCHLHTKTSGFNADRFAHLRWSRSLPFLWQGLLLSVQLQTERWCS